MVSDSSERRNCWFLTEAFISIRILLSNLNLLRVLIRDRFKILPNIVSASMETMIHFSLN